MAAGDIEIWSGNAGAPRWEAHASPGSDARAEPGGRALRFEFALAGHGAWAIARRALAFELPAHWVAWLRVRGEAAPAELQLKLVDESGANVWWWRRAGFAPAHAGERIALRRASLAFAWGPASGGEPRRVGAVELAVASDAGARG
ncbi:MAG: hypothetical protein DCC71_18620, partial [Proteobacteria bacterium]